MNRYVAEGIIADVLLGRRVLYVGQTWRGVRAALEEIEAQAGRSRVRFSRVIRSNGHERIEHESGGRVLFVSHLGSSRGVEADVVFVDAELGLERLQDLLLCVAASPCGEVMRA